MSPSGSCFECLIPSWWKTILGCREEPTMWGLTERTGSLGIDSWWYIIPDHFRSLCFLPNIMKKSPTPALAPSLVTHANPSTWEWVPGGPGVQDYWCRSLKKAKQMIKKTNKQTWLSFTKHPCFLQCSAQVSEAKKPCMNLVKLWSE